MYAAYMRLGEGNLIAGFEKMNPLPYDEAVKHVNHPVGCLDCDDSQTMQLGVTRLAFMRGFALPKRPRAQKSMM